MRFKWFVLPFIVALACLSLLSCAKEKEKEPEVREETVTSYPGGEKQVTELVKGRETTKTIIKSFEYYETGQKKKEFSHKDNHYFGAWTFWYKDGKVLAEGSFEDKTLNPAAGVGKGKYYWPSGSPMILLEPDRENNATVVVAVYDEAGNSYQPEKQPPELKEKIKAVLDRWVNGEI